MTIFTSFIDKKAAWVNVNLNFFGGLGSLIVGAAVIGFFL